MRYAAELARRNVDNYTWLVTSSNPTFYGHNARLPTLNNNNNNNIIIIININNINNSNTDNNNNNIKYFLKSYFKIA